MTTKAYIGLTAITIMGLVPAAFAFAQGPGLLARGDDDHVFIGATASTTIGVRVGDREDVDDDADVHFGASASTSAANPGEHGEKRGIVKHFGTTTPPGWERHEGSTTASTTVHVEGKDKGHGNVISALLKWIFGQPASTTVADLKAQVQASTTASSTAQVNLPPSLLHRLLGWLGVN